MFDHARRSADPYFTVLAGPVRPGQARLGLAISKKQARRAVDRNRLKRVVRETFRQHRARLPGTDIVVLARAAAVGVPRRRLTDSLEQHFTRLGERVAPAR